MKESQHPTKPPKQQEKRVSHASEHKVAILHKLESVNKGSRTFYHSK